MRSIKPLTITEADRSLLLALARLHYLTAKQAGRLLYPNANDDNRYVQRRFKRLVDNEFVLRLRVLPMPRYGQAPHVFTLARKGREYLQDLGVPVEPYFRPAEERRVSENSPFMTHRLATIDVMIAATVLCRDVPGMSCPRMLSERELKRTAIHVDVVGEEGTRRVAVIPDAWLQLQVGARPPYSIAVEVDRGSEDQKVWRQKIAAYGVWSPGPYRDAFHTDNLTVAVLCPTEARAVQLREWTRRELTLRSLAHYRELFLFTPLQPEATPPRTFFFEPVWRQPHTDAPVHLIDAPARPWESGVVFSTV